MTVTSRGWAVIAKGIWVALSVIVLVITVYDSEAPASRDNGILMVGLMFGLSFPSAYLAAVIMYEMARLSHNTVPDALGHYPAFVITWLVFFFAGYLQWFVLVPAIIRRIRRRYFTAVFHESSKTRKLFE